MRKVVCQQCGWASGEAYPQSVAKVMGRLHEDSNASHKVVTKQAWRFAGGPEKDEGSSTWNPSPDKP